MGSPSFAVPALQALAGAGYPVRLVVTQPDRPAGRGGRVTAPAVKQAALELGVPVTQPDSLKEGEAQQRIADVKPRAVVVAAYGKILPKALLALPGVAFINVHASLLPRWRGASPIAAAIFAGDAETGISLMRMEARMDAGPVFARRRIPVPPEATAGSLEGELSRLGASALVETLPAWLSGELTAESQDEELATYCWTLSKADGHLSGSWAAVQAERAVRAYNPWPGAFVGYREERLAIWKSRVMADGEAGTHPGALRVLDSSPAVAFAGGWLVLEEVQRPGGKRITGVQFLQGERGALATGCTLRD
jgi:methionyl-tRNA formyltransferase